MSTQNHPPFIRKLLYGIMLCAILFATVNAGSLPVVRAQEADTPTASETQIPTETSTSTQTSTDTPTDSPPATSTNTSIGVPSEIVTPTLQPSSTPIQFPAETYTLLHNGSLSTSWTMFAGPGVNAILGNFAWQAMDLSVSGRGLGFNFQRTYNSANTNDGPLGPGWAHSSRVRAHISGGCVPRMLPATGVVGL